MIGTDAKNRIRNIQHDLEEAGYPLKLEVLYGQLLDVLLEDTQNHTHDQFGNEVQNCVHCVHCHNGCRRNDFEDWVGVAARFLYGV